MTGILLVEDNESLGAVLSQRLEKEGYSVSWGKTVREALDIARRLPLDLAVVDLGLPDGSGFDVARAIGGESGVPILFLTAVNAAESRLQGFELGAVDYIPKPFHLKELLLRLKRALDQRGALGKLVVAGSFRLEPESFSLFTEDGARVTLPPREFKLLQLLVSNSPRALTRQEVIDALWDSAEGANARSVDNLVTRLRQLLPERLSELLRSVRGVGYRLELPVAGTTDGRVLERK